MSPRALVGVLIVVACGTAPVSPDGGGMGGGVAGGGVAGGGSADLVPPTVASTTPATGATGVAVDSEVIITFSEAMTPGSVTLTGAPPVSFSPPAMDGDGTRFIFTPAAPLVVSTAYTLTVAGTDLAGNALAGLASFSFTTRGPPDVTAPTVSAFLPTGMGVAHDAGVIITFSERMDPGSVSLQLAPFVVLELPTFDSSETVAAVAASTPFEPSTTYTATVSGNDAAGNALTGTTVFTFTTAPLPDTTRPTVRSVSPADQSTAPQNTRVTVTFSERMNTSATETAFSMRKQGGASVSGTFQWGLGGSLQLTFDPTTELDPSSVYLVSVGTGARDTSNNALLSAFTSQFTTAAARDTTPPQVTRVTPLPGSNGLSRCDWSFAITFSESMDVLSTQSAVTVSQTSPAKTIPLSYEWSRDSSRLTVSRGTSSAPVGDCFEYGAAVRLEISTGADDLAGNRLAAVFSSTATAIRQGTVNQMATVGLSRTIINSTLHVTTLVAGEAPDGAAARTLLSFQLSLPASSVVTQATLKVRLAEIYFRPFSSLGPIFVDSVDYGTTHEPTDFDTPVLASCVTVPPPPGCVALGFHRQFATDGWYGERTLDVTGAVLADLKRGTRSQFRLKFLMELSNNGTLDYVRFVGAPNSSEAQYYPRLTVTYEYP